MRKAFTLVEMMVVVGVLAILMAAMTASFSAAQTKSRITRAKAEASAITQAILAYENYVDTGITEATDQEATAEKLNYILGGGTDRAGNKIPVLYNGSLTDNKMLDPWGNVYRFTVKAVSSSENSDAVGKNLRTGVFLPNRYGSMSMRQQGDGK